MVAPRAVLLLILSNIFMGPVSAGTPTPPTTKPPEIVTIGTAPAVLSEADRAKLAEGAQRFAARRAANISTARSGFRSAAPAASKPAPVNTRVPALGARNRTKPGEAAAPVAPALAPVKTITTDVAPDKAGQP